MEYIYAAMLLNEAGKEITEANLSSVLKAAGFTPDEAKAKVVADSLKGVDIKDVIKNAQAMTFSSSEKSKADDPKITYRFNDVHNLNVGVLGEVSAAASVSAVQTAATWIRRPLFGSLTRSAKILNWPS